jgi:hypothetical protein
MASYINKWFGAFIFPIIFLMNNDRTGTHTNSPLFSVRGGKAWETHPFHVSVVQVDHNAADRSLEISCKIFTDDFEKVLEQNYKTRVDLTNPPNRSAMDTLVKKYIYAHLAVAVDGRAGKMNYIGFEHQDEAVYGYVEIDDIAPFRKMDIVDKLLHDLFKDQINLIHVTVNGKRQSTKLDYPESQATFSF